MEVAAAKPLAIRHLEIHAAHACNLACESCAHYSDYAHKGVVSLDEARGWMAPWSERLAPLTFSILGGEPTIHPDLVGFLELSRRMFPHATLRLVTNGFFLDRHPRLPEFMARDRNAILYLSIHHDAPEYRERVEPVIELLREWKRRHGILAEVYRSARNWTRRYRGQGAEMQPYADGAPRASWEACEAKFCPQLFEGCIWKCAPLAYLPMQHARFNLSQQWSPYLAYRPLEPGCSGEALAEFFSREEERQCAMCPAKPEAMKLPMPIRVVKRQVA